MSEKQSIVGEKTLIPLSFMVIIAVVVIAFTTNTNGNAETSARLGRFIEYQEKKNDIMERIDRRLARIEGKLGIHE